MYFDHPADPLESAEPKRDVSLRDVKHTVKVQPDVRCEHTEGSTPGWGRYPSTVDRLK
jgi:hypothetical protein